MTGEQYDIEPEFLTDLRSYDMQQWLAKLNKPVLIFSVAGDVLIGEVNAQDLHEWIRGESEIITLKNSDHLLSSKQDIEFVAGSIDDWFENL